MWRKRAPQFQGYVEKIFGLLTFLARYKDSRKRPQIPAGVAMWILLLGIWGRIGSLNQLEQMGKDGELDEAVPFPRKPSADTLGRVLNQADIDALWDYNHMIVRKARRNKAFPGGGTINGLMVAAIDGTEYYHTYRPSAVARRSWSRRRVTLGGKKVDHFYEQGVAINYVGIQPRLQLGEERIEPGGNEKDTALKLIKRLDEWHGWHWCDILCLDAGFVSGPFINAVRERHKHVLVKVKQDTMLVVREANAYFENRKPITLRDATCLTPQEQAERAAQQKPRHRYRVKIWDGEGFRMWREVNEPLRLLRIEEVRQVHKDGVWHDEDPQVYHIATTMPRAVLRPETVWLIMHRRWDIENSLFNDLKQNWCFRHCYTQDPNGIRALMALFSIARNLTLLFAYRHLRNFTAKRTLTTLLRQITRGLLEGLGRIGPRSRARRHPLHVPRLAAG